VAFRNLEWTLISAKILKFIRFAAFQAAAGFASVALAAAPKVNNIFPAGGQRGQTIAITVAGEFSNWPVQVWFDRPGLTATCETDKGKLKLAIAADALPGAYWLRLHDAEGASAMRPFIVGTLPEIEEVETNDSPSKMAPLEPRVTVNGRLRKNGDEDGFIVPLQKGQTLVASAAAHSVLGSPMDAVLQICETTLRTDPVTRQPETEVFVAAQNHDAIGLDPQIVFTARKEGQHLVRLFAFPSEPNSTIGFAGGDNFIYRLTLTTGGYVDHALPLSVTSAATNVTLAGWNLPDAIVELPTSDEPLAWLFHEAAAGVWPVPRVAQASIIASDASDPSQPQEVQLPVTISGRLDQAGDVDAFAFFGTKGQKVRVQVEARSLGFPTDATVTLLDAGGQVVAEQDDTGRDERDPTLTATLAADGQHRVVIRDLAGRGGLRMAYRLTVEAPQPDFQLSLTADSFVLAADKPLEIPLTVTGVEGFAESVEIRVLDLPPGVTAAPLNVQATGGNSSGGGSGRRGRRGGGGQQAAPANAKVILSADPAAIQPGGGPICIEGRFKDEEGELVRIARFPLGLPLTDKHAAVWLTVKK
jgi:hypothetical protein